MRITKSNKQCLIAYSVFAFFFVFLNVIGYFISKCEQLPVSDGLIALASALILCFPLGVLFAKLYEVIVSKSKKYELKDKRGHDIRYFFIVAAAIFICWIPILLAYWPGLFNYDARFQLQQFSNHEFTNLQPIVHSCLLWFFYHVIGQNLLGNVNAGLSICLICQMVVFAFQISYAMLFMYRLQISKKLRIVVIAWIAILPVFSIMSVSTTKDVLFSGFFVDFAVVLLYWFKFEPLASKYELCIITALSCVGMILFRSNGLYPVLVVLVLSLIFFRKKLWCFKRIVLCCIAFCLIFNFATQAAFKMKNVSAKEAASIPIQQVAYIYKIHNSEISAEDKEAIEYCLPSIANYNRFIVDYAKQHGNKNASFSKFLNVGKVYLKFLAKYPYDCFVAALSNDLGFYYALDTSVADIYGHSKEKHMGYLSTEVLPGYNIELTSLLPQVRDAYDTLFNANEYQDIPIVNLAFSIPIYIWAMLFACIAILLRKTKCWIFVVFVFTMLCTSLLGPCVLVRYALPYLLVVPVCFSALKKFEVVKKG